MHFFNCTEAELNSKHEHERVHIFPLRFSLFQFHCYFCVSMKCKIVWMHVQHGISIKSAHTDLLECTSTQSASISILFHKIQLIVELNKKLFSYFHKRNEDKKNILFSFLQLSFLAQPFFFLSFIIFCFFRFRFDVTCRNFHFFLQSKADDLSFSSGFFGCSQIVTSYKFLWM